MDDAQSRALELIAENERLREEITWRRQEKRHLSNVVGTGKVYAGLRKRNKELEEELKRTVEGYERAIKNMREGAPVTMAQVDALGKANHDQQKKIIELEAEQERLHDLLVRAYRMYRTAKTLGYYDDDPSHIALMESDYERLPAEVKRRIESE